MHAGHFFGRRSHVPSFPVNDTKQDVLLLPFGQQQRWQCGLKNQTKTHSPSICRETPARSNNLYLMRISLRRTVHFAATSKISRAILNRQATHTVILPNNAGSNNPQLLSPLSSDKPETRSAVPAQHRFNHWTTRQTEDSVLLQGLAGIKRLSAPSRRHPTIALWTTGTKCGSLGSPMPISRLLYVLIVMGKIWPHGVSVPFLGKQTR